MRFYAPWRKPFRAFRLFHAMSYSLLVFKRPISR
jgi:hypothetical protein